MPKNNRNFWESAKYNNQAFMLYYNRLLEIALARFEWQRIPETVDPRFLELALFGDGCSIFFEDDVLGYLALRSANGGPLNVYDVPINRRAYGSNGYNQDLTQDNSVIIYNNFLRTNSIPIVQNFAQRLWNLDRTIDTNINAQKTPLLIVCDETQRLAMKNLYMKYQGNEPVIMGDKNGLRSDAIKVLSTGAPYVAGNLYDIKQKIWNDALTYLGVTNSDTNKKERLITDEVAQNQGGTIISRYSQLAARQQACEQINKMFGLDIWCDFRRDELPPEMTEIPGGEPNE